MFAFFLNQAEPIFGTEGDHQRGEVFIGHPGAKLAVEAVACGRAQWIAIEVIDSALQILSDKQRSGALKMVDVVLQTFVSASRAD